MNEICQENLLVEHVQEQKGKWVSISMLVYECDESEGDIEDTMQ